MPHSAAEVRRCRHGTVAEHKLGVCCAALPAVHRRRELRGEGNNITLSPSAGDSDACLRGEARDAVGSDGRPEPPRPPAQRRRRRPQVRRRHPRVGERLPCEEGAAMRGRCAVEDGLPHPACSPSCRRPRPTGRAAPRAPSLPSRSRRRLRLPSRGSRPQARTARTARPRRR